MARTKIEWTDMSWNFLRGCTMISHGCAHCYAMLQAHRFNYPGGAYEGLTEMGPNGPRWNGNIRVVDDKLAEPLSVRKPAKWFVNSMSDLFHDDVPEETIEEAFAVMALADRHCFQILTKRPERMREILDGEFFWAMVEGRAQRRYHEQTGEDPSMWLAVHGPLQNVWLGVSVEDQETLESRQPILCEVPAAVRFLSYEPALGPIRGIDLRVDWVIIGGESGPSARPFDINWARQVLYECTAVDIRCFVKQFGSRPWASSFDGVKADHLFNPCGHECNCCDDCPSNDGQISEDEHPKIMRLKDKKGADPSEWPLDLKVQQFPRHSLQGESVAGRR
jgi:protein gp37